jgi:hypothetical protein
LCEEIDSTQYATPVIDDVAPKDGGVHEALRGQNADALMRATTTRCSRHWRRRMRAAPMFIKWCELNGLAMLGGASIVAFVTDCAALGIERLWLAIQGISRLHVSVGLLIRRWWRLPRRS